jgi:hypothetical protein
MRISGNPARFEPSFFEHNSTNYRHLALLGEDLTRTGAEDYTATFSNN